MSNEVEAAEVMHFLHTLYSRYDTLLDTWGVYKVETVGDCYVVAGGLIEQDSDGFGCVVRYSTGPARGTPADTCTSTCIRISTSGLHTAAQH